MDGVTATRIVTRSGSDRPGPAATWLLLAGLAIFSAAALAQDAEAPPPQAAPSASPAESQTSPSAPPADSPASPGAQAQGQSPLVEEPEQTAPSQPPPIAAVWKERKLSFSYNGSTTVYSCRAMADRVAGILRAVGARDDVKVRVSGCSNVPTSDPYANSPVSGRRTDPLDPMNPGPSRHRYQGAVANTRQVASVYVTAMLPTVVTGDVSAELEKDKARRELVARVTGNPAARFDDPVLFAARVQQVTLSKKTIGIEPEECELVDQLTSTILPQIDVRTISRTSTICEADSLLSPQVVVEALMPVRYGNGGTMPPLKGEGPTGEGDGEKRDDGAPPTQ